MATRLLARAGGQTGRSPHPLAALVLTQRPGVVAQRVVPTLHAQGLPTAVLGPNVALELDTLPAPFRDMPEHTVAIVEDPHQVSRALDLGFGLVAGLGSGARARALLDAGAELTLGSPAELCAGTVGDAFAGKFLALPSPLEHVDRISVRLGGRAAVVVDADGLLAGPGGARLRVALSRLARRMPVALTSSRPAGELARTTAGGAPYLAGSYGLDQMSPRDASRARERMDRVHDLLLGLIAQRPGVRLQHQGLVLRLDLAGTAAPDRPQLRRGVVRALTRVRGVELEAGPEELVLRPALRWDARDTLSALRARWEVRWGVRTALYLAGTAHHEPALRTLRREGIGVRIGPGAPPTSAAFRLPDAGAAVTLLSHVGL